MFLYKLLGIYFSWESPEEMVPPCGWQGSPRGSSRQTYAIGRMQNPLKSRSVLAYLRRLEVVPRTMACQCFFPVLIAKAYVQLAGRGLRSMDRTIADA